MRKNGSLQLFKPRGLVKMTMSLHFHGYLHDDCIDLQGQPVQRAWYGVWQVKWFTNQHCHQGYERGHFELMEDNQNKDIIGKTVD